jgi:hypothetical protein
MKTRHGSQSSMSPSSLGDTYCACKGLHKAGDAIFPRVEHRECTRHLSIYFMKKFKSKIFKDNFWSSSYTYTPGRHATDMQNMYTTKLR